MIRNRYRGEPSRWHLLFLGLLLGLAIGLFIGWWLWPVNWTNSWPTDLSQPAKADYLAAVADAYVADGSAQAKDLADMRLNTMRENLVQEIVDAKVYFSNNGPNPNIRISNLDQLATALGATGAIGSTEGNTTSNQSGNIDPATEGTTDNLTGNATDNFSTQTDAAQSDSDIDNTSGAVVEGEGESTLASWIPWLLTLLSGLLLLLGALYILYLLSNRRMREQGHPNQSTPHQPMQSGPSQHQPELESYNEDFAPPQPYSDDEYDLDDEYHFGEEEIDEGQWRLTSGQMAQNQFAPTEQAPRDQLGSGQPPGNQPPARQQGRPTQRHRASLPSPRGQAQPASTYEPTGYEPPAQRQMTATQRPQQEHFQRTAPAIATAVNAGANPAGNRQVPAQQQAIEPYPDEEFFDDPFDDADDMAFDNETFDWSDTDPNRTINLTPGNVTSGNVTAQPHERSAERSQRSPAEDDVQFRQAEPEPIRSEERAVSAAADQGLESLPEEIKSERFAMRQGQAPNSASAATSDAPTIDKALMKQPRESSLVDKYVAHYHIGDHDYTQLYEIETEDGDHLGEFGIDIDGIHGILNQNPEYVTVLDVWLYDVTSEDSQTQLLLSQHARENGAGDTSRSDRRPLPAQPGLKFQLEGSNLLLDCEVSEAKFLGNNGPSGIFQSVTVEISAYRKNG